jgi:hypothetical protein
MNEDRYITPEFILGEEGELAIFLCTGQLHLFGNVGHRKPSWT